MKFILGLGWMFGVTLTAMAFVIAPFPSVAQPVDRAGEFPTRRDARRLTHVVGGRLV